MITRERELLSIYNKFLSSSVRAGLGLGLEAEVANGWRVQDHEESVALRPDCSVLQADADRVDLQRMQVRLDVP